MNATAIKANGIHYTPPELAQFLAEVTAEHAAGRTTKILDPACGDGMLLAAFVNAVPKEVRREMELFGYDTDPSAVREARCSLAKLGVKRVTVEQEDFLTIAQPADRQRSFFDRDAQPQQMFDVVISNPPYVRTQVLGAARAQSLARQFSLKGRVDLYHAFAAGMAHVLRPGGTLGLLTSNRFLTIKSGSSLRQLLREQFGLQAIYDLGDTKLFSAAVLPVIVIGRKSERSTNCRFDRVYEHRNGATTATLVPSILGALRQPEIAGIVHSSAGAFRIERGFLPEQRNGDVWTLATCESQDWLARVRERTQHTFAEVAQIRVGIKTTADEVFIRHNWSDLPKEVQPELELVRPLIRHFDATRWGWSGHPEQSVLYPHIAAEGKRQPIELSKFPRAKEYLETHKERLTRRQYVIDGGRKWYEIWVPHHPDDWASPKIVFPDIAEEPRFFLDTTGAIVNGDCYWMTLRPGFGHEHLLLMLAVANSSFITRYYDVAFHNKLYAGRRRFMTQYVKQFPLPSLNSDAARRAIQYVAQLVQEPSPNRGLEDEIDKLVWEAFELVKEIAG